MNITEQPKRLAQFYFDVRAELKKVTWPGKKEVYGTTTVVIITVFFFGIYLALADFVSRRLVDFITGIFD